MGLIAQFIIMVISLKTRLDDLNSLGGINVTGNGALYAGTDLSTLSGAVAGFAVARSLSGESLNFSLVLTSFPHSINRR